MLKSKLTRVSSLILIASAIQAASPARGDLIFGGSSGSLAASADFSLSGTTLTITLTNTSTADVLVPSDVLTAVLFNTSHTLTPVSASLNGSSVYYGSIVNDVGEGWEYKSGFNAQGMNSGISASGLGGTFGPDGNFFSPGVSSDGLAYGILSAGDNPATGNTGVTGSGPLIKNSIQFTLTVAAGFSLSELGSSVVFQYGTALTEPSFTGNTPPPPAAAPEPSTLVLAISALPVGLVLLARKRRRARTA